MPEPAAAPLPLTSFQRALKQADAMQATRASQPGWRDEYADETYWLGVVHRPVEDVVFERLQRHHALPIISMLREVLGEMAYERKYGEKRPSELPLRELLARRGQTLAFIEVGSKRKSQIISVAVPLAAS